MSARPAKKKRLITRAEAGARFDAVMTEFRDAWAKHSSAPFEVDGNVTPAAMEFIAGYVAGVTRFPEIREKSGENRD